MNKDELINRIREAIESDEDEIVKVVTCQFLFDEFDRSMMEASA